ncbi:MAG: hypothetical protein KME26_33095 [Oscillatoria princeps RMCB-10]|nr:hypothetical protein [Oscillatoria princeps RMCB-10]
MPRYSEPQQIEKLWLALNQISDESRSGRSSRSGRWTAQAGAKGTGYCARTENSIKFSRLQASCQGANRAYLWAALALRTQSEAAPDSHRICPVKTIEINGWGLLK